MISVLLQPAYFSHLSSTHSFLATKQVAMVKRDQNFECLSRKRAATSSQWTTRTTLSPIPPSRAFGKTPLHERWWCEMVWPQQTATSSTRTKKCVPNSQVCSLLIVRDFFLCMCTASHFVQHEQDREFCDMLLSAMCTLVSTVSFWLICRVACTPSTHAHTDE